MKRRKLESKKPNNFHSFCSFSFQFWEFDTSTSFSEISQKLVFWGRKPVPAFWFLVFFSVWWHMALLLVLPTPPSQKHQHAFDFYTLDFMSCFSLTDCTGKIKSMSSSRAASPYRNTHSRGHSNCRLIPRTAGWFKACCGCSRGTANTSSFSKSLTMPQPSFPICLRSMTLQISILY